MEITKWKQQLHSHHTGKLNKCNEREVLPSQPKTVESYLSLQGNKYGLDF